MICNVNKIQKQDRNFDNKIWCTHQKETENKLLNKIKWKIREIKMQQIFYIWKSRN